MSYTHALYQKFKQGTSDVWDEIITSGKLDHEQLRSLAKQIHEQYSTDLFSRLLKKVVQQPSSLGRLAVSLVFTMYLTDEFQDTTQRHDVLYTSEQVLQETCPNLYSFFKFITGLPKERSVKKTLDREQYIWRSRVELTSLIEEAIRETLPSC